MSHDRWVKVWEITGLACQALRWEVKGSEAGINHCQFSADGGELYTGGSDGRVRVWAAADGTALREHVPPDGGRTRRTAIFAFVLSRTGRDIAWCGSTWSAPHHIVVGRTKSLAVTRRIPAHGGETMILAAYPGGFCSGSVDRTVKFWDWRSKTCHHTLKARGVVRALATSADGKRVAVGGVATIAVHDLADRAATGAAVHFRGHTKCIECIEFSPDGARLASASTDGTLRVWDAATGECVRTFALKLGGLHWVSFAPDGLTLAFSSLRGDIGLLDLDE